MARTYTDTPEPRYVERAKESETTSALPEIKNADRGKFLKVKANKNELMYDSIPSEVPEPAIADAGKVLGVDDEGKYALVESRDSLIATYNNGSLDITWNELKRAIDSGKSVIFITTETSIDPDYPDEPTITTTRSVFTNYIYGLEGDVAVSWAGVAYAVTYNAPSTTEIIPSMFFADSPDGLLHLL